MAAQLQFRDVTLGYDRHPAVHHLDGEVAAGALLAVIGPNGAGKSTLFRGIAGILKPLAGAISLGGLDHRDIAYLPQTADIDRSFPISVFDFVGTGLWRSTGFFGGMGKAEQAKIAQALAAVGLNGFENRWRWSSAGTAKSAPCWRRCTTWIWCAAISPKPCCWPVARWRGARPRRC